MPELAQWMESVSGDDWYWYVKFLSGNDTLLNETHQAGPYIPRQVILDLFPSVSGSPSENPRADLPAIVDSHSTSAELKVIWYNNRLRGGTRNECRITNWGGRSSPLLDPEATGSLCVFAFHQVEGADADICRVWLCDSPDEEDAVQDRTGPVEPGVGFVYTAGSHGFHIETHPLFDSPCRLRGDELPADWRFDFPDAASVVAFSVRRLPTAYRQSPDDRLVRRRDCEYEVFRSIEELIVLPRIREGFATVDHFVDYANSVTNRRKSRSGASLEHHARTIFDEEHLPYSHDEISEERKRPDFLFPSAEAYRNLNYPASRLQMLGVKTTCKDRWRQIISEADRIRNKYLLTLQEGISPSQFAEMQAAHVILVVPQRLHGTYHSDVRPHLLSLADFIDRTRTTCLE